MTATRQPLALLLLLLGSFVLPAVAEDNTTAMIQREISRLQEALKANTITDKDFVQANSMTEDALKAAADALKNGHLYLSLVQLGEAEGGLSGAQRLSDKSALAKADMAAYESEWGKVSLRLTALERDAHAMDWKNAPLAIRALAEKAQGTSLPLLEGGRGFAIANGPRDGLFYLGQSEGEADFAAFCASLKLGGRPSSFPLRSLLPELQALQQRVNAAFQPPKSIDLHPRFISLNSTIKQAEELDASRFYAGALLSYLEAVRHYGMLDAPPLDASGQEKVKQDLAAAQKRLAASANDESVPELFLERAGAFVQHADGSAPSADEWRGARVILDQVLPAYYAAQKPAMALPSAAGKTVNITLVRWPYT